MEKITRFRTDKTMYVDFDTGEIINYESEKQKGGIYVEKDKGVHSTQVGNCLIRQWIVLVKKISTQKKLF